MSIEQVDKRNVIIGKREGMALVDFHAHWSGPHATHAMTIPGVLRYIQSHVIRPLWRSTDRWDGLEGFVELVFASPDALSTALSRMPNVDDLLTDEARFLGRWTSCSAIAQPGMPMPSQRRIVVILSRPQGVLEDAFREEITAYLAKTRRLCPCYADETLDRQTRKRPQLPHFDWPDWFIHFDPLPDADLPGLLAGDGSILTGLAALSGEGAAFLTRTEAKVLPHDRDAGGGINPSGAVLRPPSGRPDR